MDEDLKVQIHEIEEMTRDNSRILRKLQRTVWWSQFFSVLRWVIIIGLAVGAFYFFQPFFTKIDQIYQYVTGNHLPDFSSFFK